MRVSRLLALGLILFGAVSFALCQALLGAIPENLDSSTTSGNLLFYVLPAELFTGLGTTVVKGARLLLGVMPLCVGLLGLVTSWLPGFSIPIASSGPANFEVEEPWEYLPQEGRGRRPAQSEDA